MTVYQHFFSRGRFANYQQIQSEMGFSDPFINEKPLNIGWNNHSIQSILASQANMKENVLVFPTRKIDSLNHCESSIEETPLCVFECTDCIALARRFQRQYSRAIIGQKLLTGIDEHLDLARLRNILEQPWDLGAKKGGDVLGLTTIGQHWKDARSCF